MKAESLSRVEKIILGLGALVVALVLCGVWYLQNVPQERTEVTDPADTEETVQETLSGADYFLPDNLTPGQALPTDVFQNARGETVDLSEAYPDSWLVLMFWGTWCPYCEQQLEYLEQFQTIADAQGDTELILVNKTDESKEETVEKAEQYLKNRGWDGTNHVYDPDLKVYRAYAVKRIPTTIVVDENGIVRAMAAETLDGEALKNLLQQAKTANCDALLAFLRENMTNSQGGIFTAYRDGTASSPQGHDVLSESMGLMMRCAVILEDRTLFDRCLAYVSEQMARDGVFVWYVDSGGTQGEANALLDDLRIARALYDANEVWGGYEQPLEALVKAILAKNTYRGQLSSFYDFRQSRAGSSISLAYGDFETLQLMTKVCPEYAAYADALLEVTEGGFIGQEFPLYYSSYDYQKETYSRDDLNTAEALMTLCHLAQVGQLRQETLMWLKNALETDTLYARYRVDGTPVEGYCYDSTAVYAIAALIGDYTGDAELFRMARGKMEESFQDDPNSRFYGAFTRTDDGSDIQAFDQLIPLLVYCRERSAYISET